MSENLEDIPNCPLHPNSKRLLCKECCWDAVVAAREDERRIEREVRELIEKERYEQGLRQGASLERYKIINIIEKEIIENADIQKQNLSLKDSETGEVGLVLNGQEAILHKIHKKIKEGE